jgi:hypothetical protein
MRAFMLATGIGKGSERRDGGKKGNADKKGDDDKENLNNRIVYRFKTVQLPYALNPNPSLSAQAATRGYVDVKISLPIGPTCKE